MVMDDDGGVFDCKVFWEIQEKSEVSSVGRN